MLTAGRSPAHAKGRFGRAAQSETPLESRREAAKWIRQVEPASKRPATPLPSRASCDRRVFERMRRALCILQGSQRLVGLGGGKAKMMNVLTIVFIVAGAPVERKLHFSSTEECLVAQRAPNHSTDAPSKQPDQERIIYHCDFN
jgi:hypothetical protein